jgi:hypothetical protein
MKLKFLFGLCLANTVLFTVAILVGLSIWWVLLAEVALWIGYIMVKAWFDPTQQLVNQGARMGWAAAGTVRDPEGFRDIQMKRDDVTVRISYADKRIYIVAPTPSGPYESFLDVGSRMINHPFLKQVRV